MPSFPFSNISTLCKLFCTYVRPSLEYCSSIRSPQTLERIDLFENVQHSFTRRLPGLSSLSYQDRLIVTNLPSLEIRRLRTDCILLYNILHKKIFTLHNMFTFRSDVSNSNVATREHNLKLFISHLNCNIVKFSFFYRTAMIWNTLVNDIVNAPNSKLFNERLSDTHLHPFVRGRTSM